MQPATSGGVCDVYLSLNIQPRVRLPPSLVAGARAHRSLMNFRKKVISWILVFVVMLIFIGWFTSTRHIDIQFLEEDTPLSGCELFVTFSTRSNTPESFLLDQDGKIRIPDTYAGHRAAYALIRDGEVIHEVYERQFRRGITTVNFRASGLESTRRYRFLLYESSNPDVLTNISK